MKRKIFCVLSSLLLIICMCFAPFNARAVSPEATLTVDGAPAGNFPSVQAAVDAVTSTPGTNFVIEIAGGTVSDPLNITQQPNKNVVVRPQPGATVTFTNTITVDGNGNLNSPETLLIEGLHFDLSSGSPTNCIYFNLIPPHVGFAYPHNVTINGCTFKGVFDTTVAVQSVPGGSRNIAIMNCTAENMHSLAQPKAVSGYMFVQNCTVKNSSGGVNYYGVGDLIIDSCNFSVEEYAVRSGQGVGVIQNGSVNINNSILTSNSPTVGTVVLRGDSSDNINIIHSDIKNNNPAGSAIQNLNAASQNLYNIDVVESNVTGQITDINQATITTIDDPNVQNGPVSVNVTPDDGALLPAEIVILVAAFLALALVLLMIFYLQ